MRYLHIILLWLFIDCIIKGEKGIYIVYCIALTGMGRLMIGWRNAGAHSIGLLLGRDEYEYPLWVALKTKNQGKFEVDDELRFGDNVY